MQSSVDSKDAGIRSQGFFENGEDLANQVGKKFDIKERAKDTEVFKNRNVHFSKNFNSEIVKKMIRKRKKKTSKTLVIKKNSWKRNSGNGFKVEIKRH